MNIFVFSYSIKEQDGDIVVEYVFGRRLTGFIVTTMLPTVSANIIGYVTVFFVDEAFEAAHRTVVIRAGVREVR